MDLGLRGRVALITGGSRGIGAATALAFAREGARVAVCARGQDDLDQLARRLADAGAESRMLAADLLREGEAERVVREVEGAFGAVDVLVNNLGGGRAEDTEEAWDFTFDINLGAARRACRAAIPGMKARRRGVLVLISSISGRMVGGSAPAYNAAKAAEIMYARSLARDLAPHGVRALSVAPGSILFDGGGWQQRIDRDPARIDAFVREALPLGRFGTPEEVADVVVFASSERASLVTGACIDVDGCQLRPSV